MSRQRQWALLCIGVWLTGTIALAVVVTGNFYAIDRLLAHSPNPAFREAIEKLGPGFGHDLLQYLSAEMSRLYLQWWNLLQMLLASLALYFLRPLGQGNRAGWYVVGMFSVTLFLTLVLTPPMVRIGRDLDFVPRDPVPHDLRTLGLLNAAYSVFTLVNLILGALTIRELRSDGEPVEEGASHG
ncbi:MAG TPA: hypothetical protein VFY29_13860 [Terriglobia bacterium]|nr:hypothetical protein [Terriglobia bacterium]